MGVLARTIEGARSGIALEKLSAYQVASAAVVATILLAAMLPRFDPDLWWHMYVGRYIVQHASVPTTDFLSYTARSRPWIDHEWLAEVLMYGAYRWGGFPLLFLGFGAVTAGAYGLSYLRMCLKGVYPLLGLVLTMVGAAAGFALWGARVQMITLLGAAAACIVLDQYQRSGRRVWLASLVPLLWLWSNLHGGFVIGLLLIALYAAGSFLDGLRARFDHRTLARLVAPLLATLCVGALVTILNPNTYRQLLYPLNFLLPNAFTNTIAESQPPNFHLFQVLPFEMLLLGVMVAAFLGFRSVSWVDILLVAVFTHLALQQTRNVPLWCIVVTPVLAVHLQGCVQPLIRTLARWNRSVGSRMVGLSNWVLLLLFAATTVIMAGRILNSKTVLAAQQRTFPAGAIAYLSHHRLSGNGFNSYSYGGYLIWNLAPRYPVFIDSRADTVYGDTTLHDYLSVWNASESWRAVLARYRIRWVLVERQAPIAQVLSGRSGWLVVFRGRLATIIVLKGVTHA